MGSSGSWYNPNVLSLAFSPNYASAPKIAAGTGWGVYFSHSGGASWGGFNWFGTVNSVAFSPGYASDSTVYAGGSHGLVKSTDGFSTWTNLATTLPSGPAVSAVVPSPNHAKDDVLFVSTRNYGVYKSTDRGANWEAANAGLTTADVLSLAAAPTFSTGRTLFAGTYSAGIWRTIWY